MAGTTETGTRARTGRQNRHRRLSRSAASSYVFESIVDCSDSDFLWFQPSHRAASREDVEVLARVLARMRGIDSHLRPESPPPEMMQLLARMSAETREERDLILECLRMYAGVIRVKEVGSVNSQTTVKEISNPKGMSGGAHLLLRQYSHQCRQVLTKNMGRQVKLTRKKASIGEAFQKSLMEVRLMQDNLVKFNKARLQAHQALLARKRKGDMGASMAMPEVASCIDNQRRFWESWKCQDGPFDESYRHLNANFGDRAAIKAEKLALRDPEERARQIDIRAYEYADTQMRHHSLPIHYDTDAVAPEWAAKSGPKPEGVDAVFSHRDAPTPSLSHLPLAVLRSHYSSIYRHRRPTSAAILHSTADFPHEQTFETMKGATDQSLASEPGSPEKKQLLRDCTPWKTLQITVLSARDIIAADRGVYSSRMLNLCRGYTLCKCAEANLFAVGTGVS